MIKPLRQLDYFLSRRKLRRIHDRVEKRIDRERARRDKALENLQHDPNGEYLIVAPEYAHVYPDHDFSLLQLGKFYRGKDIGWVRVDKKTAEALGATKPCTCITCCKKRK